MVNTPLAERVCEAMLHNAGLFLRKAVEEIVGHDDTSDAAFDVDRATLVTVLIQMGVELVSTAIVLRTEGLASIVKPKDLPVSTADAEARWAAGTIKTLTFEEIKLKAAKYFGDEGFWDIIGQLQHSRNKLMHFHAPLDTGDRFDLKYDATRVLVQVVLALLRTDEYDFAYVAEALMGGELYQRLLSFGPYRDRIAAQAREMERLPLRCPMCSIRTYLPNGEACIGCGWSGVLRLLTCPSCDERSVIYDHLNLPLNSWLNAVCGNCEWEGGVSHCHECDFDYTTEKYTRLECPWIDDHDQRKVGKH
ncbi:hypothetical protein FJ970_10420 [Mesorhizobium sp. B2-1-8]|uniref:hypothetical protein n=1 Tax=Mesorhizobium sp. B2-1-8 TaxID=2589967 RepID=UPI00112C652D|nr:hypothetical protein [Mesorhizobium sp. B2-1-8]UCI21337.1 hypothetical protein FJ970_10420 [Mesorhizobium sp. B2-1-8]